MKKLTLTLLFLALIITLGACARRPSQVTMLRLNWVPDVAYLMGENVVLEGKTITAKYDDNTEQTFALSARDIAFSGSGVLLDPVRLNTTSAGEGLKVVVSYGGVNLEMVFDVYHTIVLETGVRYHTNPTVIETGHTLVNAVALTPENSRIYIAEGTHYTSGVSQLVINKNLSFIGHNPHTTILKPTANTGTGWNAGARGWFAVMEDVECNIRNVTFDGTGYNIVIALFTWGTGIIENNRFVNIVAPSYSGLSIGAYGNVTIRNNDFLHHQGRIAVHVYDQRMDSDHAWYTGVPNADNVIIEGNTFRGNGSGPSLQYGIEVGGIAQATITNNTFSNYGTSETAWSSAAIYVNDYWIPNTGGSGAIITGNTIIDSEVGIYVGNSWLNDLSEVLITGNTLSNITHFIIKRNPTVTLDLALTLSENTFSPDAEIIEDFNKWTYWTLSPTQ